MPAFARCSLVLALLTACPHQAREVRPPPPAALSVPALAPATYAYAVEMRTITGVDLPTGEKVDLPADARFTATTTFAARTAAQGLRLEAAVNEITLSGSSADLLATEAPPPYRATTATSIAADGRPGPTTIGAASHPMAGALLSTSTLGLHLEYRPPPTAHVGDRWVVEQSGMVIRGGKTKTREHWAYRIDRTERCGDDTCLVIELTTRSTAIDNPAVTGEGRGTYRARISLRDGGLVDVNGHASGRFLQTLGSEVTTLRSEETIEVTRVGAPLGASVAAPPAPDPTWWPAAPAHLSSVADSLAAAPPWWSTAVGGLVPTSTASREIFLDANEHPDPDDERAGVACRIGPPLPETTTSISVVPRSGAPLIQYGEGPIFVPGLDPALVKRVAVQTRRVHHESLADFVVKVIAPPLAPLIVATDGRATGERGTLATVGPLPWSFDHATCIAVPRAIVEHRVSAALRDLDACMERPRPAAPLETPDPPLDCLGSIVGLLGWSDPRSQAAVARYAARAEVAQRTRAAALAALAPTSTIGDHRLGPARVTAGPSKGTPRLALDVHDEGVASLAALPRAWWRDAPSPALDASGVAFRVRWYVTGANEVRPRRPRRISAVVSPTIADVAPRSPLVVRLPLQTSVVPLELGRATRVAVGAATLTVTLASARCDRTTRRVRATLVVTTDDDRAAIPDGTLALVGIPRGGEVEGLQLETRSVVERGTVTGDGVLEQLAACPPRYGIAHRALGEQQWVRVDLERR